MDEKLQEALSKLLEKTLNGVDTAGDFLAEEIPDVLSQLLMWHGVYNFVMFTMSILLAVTGIRLVTKTMSNLDTKEHWAHSAKDNEPISFTGLMVIVIGLLSFGTGCVLLNFQWLKVWLAPKVWLLEYAAQLTK